MILGIDIGGTTIKFGIVTEKGEILATERHDTLENTKTSEDFINLLIEISKKFIVSYPQIKGIGIGVPGQLSLDRSTLVQANNLGALNGTKIVPLLKDAFPDLVVRLENDANCTALGEMYFGGHYIHYKTITTILYQYNWVFPPAILVLTVRMHQPCKLP